MPHDPLQDAPQDDMDHRTYDRRTVVKAAGSTAAGLAGAAALAACGSGGDSTGTGAAPAASPTTSGAAGTSGTASVSAGAPGGTPVKASSVPVGGGVIDTEHTFVVTQPTSGTFKAFSAICTHMGCTLTKVTSGFIDCPCHGSRFDIATGTPTSDSQARRPLTGKTATVSGDSVYVS